MNSEFKHMFTADEHQLMKHLSALWREVEDGIVPEYEACAAMDAAGNEFESVHGEGSVRSIFSRINQAIAWKREQKELAHRCAMRALSGSKVGDLASWLSKTDAEFLRQIGVTL
jgi:hypothetical protein